MPDLDGYEATRAIRRSEADGNFGHRPTHVIIALTANAMEGDREKCLQVGMDDFLTKPFEIESLRTALEKAATSLEIRWDSKTQPLLPETVASVGAFPAASAVGHSSGVEFDRSFVDGFRTAGSTIESNELNDLIDLFLLDLPTQEAELKRASRVHDTEATRAAAHSIKGTAGNFGGRRVAAIAGEIEMAVKENSWSAVPILIQRLAEAIQSLLAILKIEKRAP